MPKVHGVSALGGRMRARLPLTWGCFALRLCSQYLLDFPSFSLSFLSLRGKVQGRAVEAGKLQEDAGRPPGFRGDP